MLSPQQADAKLKTLSEPSDKLKQIKEQATAAQVSEWKRQGFDVKAFWKERGIWRG